MILNQLVPYVEPLIRNKQNDSDAEDNPETNYPPRRIIAHINMHFSTIVPACVLYYMLTVDSMIVTA